MRMPATPISMVAGERSSTCSNAGSPETIDVPKSPRTSWPR